MSKRRSHRIAGSSKSGAALLIAIGVLALLLLISVSFFRMATQELQVATSHADNVQAELLVDGAFAIAIDTLQQDAVDHPEYTSNDHPWRTRFNGAWAIGKWWTAPYDRFGQGHRVYEMDPLTGIHAKYPPVVDIDALQFALNQTVYLGFTPTTVLEFDPEWLHRYMYIPRIENHLASGSIALPHLPGFINPATGTVDLNRYLARDANGDELFPFAFSTDLDFSNLSGFGGVPYHAYGLPYDLLAQYPYDPTLNAGLRFASVSGAELLPEQQVHFFADVDTNGDGLNDAIWIPMAADRLYPNDGIDNDLDGYIDEFDLDGEPGLFLVSEFNYDRNSDDDAAAALGRVVFTMPLSRMFQMRDPNAPNPTWVPLGVVPADLDFQPTTQEGANGNTFSSTIKSLDYFVTPSEMVTTPTVLLSSDIGDNKDNDFNQIIDDGTDATHHVLNRVSRLALNRFLTGGAPLLSDDPAFDNHYSYEALLGKIAQAINNGFQVRILGETDSEIVGRVAIHIEDEASKVNVNVAGGMSYVSDKRTFDFDGSGNFLGIDELLDDRPMVKATGNGFDPTHYDLRTMYDVGEPIAERVWNVRMGSILTDGVGGLDYGSGLSISGITDSFDPTVPGFEADYGNLAYDVSFPGYGFVDDDGSMFAMLTNGIDDDGDAYWYQHDGIDNDMNGLIDDAAEGVDEGLKLYDLDGDGTGDAYPTPEGIDEPQEYQQYRPYRNIAAELDTNPPNLPNFGNAGDPNDNDSDGVPNEIGELGDRPYRTTQQLKLVNALINDRFQNMDPFVTAHSSDSNLSFDYRSGFGWANAANRTATGIKVDVNFASPAEIARSLTLNFPYTASEPRIVDGLGNRQQTAFNDDDVLDFAAGLRQEDTTVLSSTPILGLTNTELEQNGSDFWANRSDPNVHVEQVQFAADAELRALQLAVTAKDFADSNFGRSTLQLAVDDPWLLGALNVDPGSIIYTQAGIEAVRINEVMVRPVRRIEAEADTDSGSFTDPYNPNWFSENIGALDFDFDVYTTAGLLPSFTPVLNDAANPIDVGATGYDWATDPALTNVLPALGIQSAWATYRSTVRFGVDVDSDSIRDAIVEMPNLIEFEFRASEQLPAGRYYLTVNTQTVARTDYENEEEVDVFTGDIVNSVFSEQDFLYFTADSDALADDGFGTIIEQLAAQRIVEAVGGAVTPNLDIFSEVQSPAVLGRDALNNLTGMAFMQSNDIYRGFTVEVPPIGSGSLHVAIARTRPDPEDGATNPGTPLAINYFEFSQEPDHEYVELVNISESPEPMDVSGWKIKVTNGAELTIPDDTFIAPEGYLLVGVNKFDYMEAYARAFDVNDLNYDSSGAIAPVVSASTDINPVIFRNGIGLAQGEVPDATDIGTEDTSDWFEQITIPPIFDGLNRVFQTESYFDTALLATRLIDVVDNTGDGRHDSLYVTISGPPTTSGKESIPDDFVRSTVDASRISGGHSLGLTNFDKPWDRIVEARITGSNTGGYYATTAAGIGRFVLDGGIFPNYPEQDGRDNDLDNQVLAAVADPNVVSGDGIDNDGDGVYDEVGEGIDEGRARLAPGNVLVNVPYAGGYHIGRIPFNTSSYLDYEYPIEQNGVASALPPPAWKKFVEERLFPGDNVIVTLYTDGGTDDSFIVDQVTYTQLDVTDRSKDDVLERPAGIPGPNSTLPATWWPDTMGIDFYKSLERKHPLYNGDKHGTQNRLQATDGAYDDWADSTHYHVRDIEMMPANSDTLFTFNPFGGANTANPLLQIAQAGSNYDNMFSHRMFGSPLRMNFSQRIIENPPLQESINFGSINEFTRLGQFDYWFDDFFASPPAVPVHGARIHRNYLFPEVRVRNRALVSPGDLLGLPHFDRIERIATVQQGYAFDQSNPNHRRIMWDSGVRTLLFEDASIRQIALGQTFGDVRWDEALNTNFGEAHFFSLDFRVRDNATNLARYADHGPVNLEDLVDYSVDDEAGINDLSNDLTQLIGNTAVSDSLSLSVATAEVVAFGTDTLWSPDASAPQDWSPVLTMPLGGESVGDSFTTPLQQTWDMQFLFGSTMPSLLPATVDSNRWPPERRAAFFASRNVDANTPKQALFIWDGNDGVENGEYDLYIGVSEDLDPLLGNTDHTLDSFGSAIASIARRTDHTDMTMNITAMTDRDGDGRVWWNSDPVPFQPTDLNTLATQAGVDEGFGPMNDASPYASGFINYGSVTIENNFLALFIENTADPTVLNRISRVVLAPRTRTPGRININTIETQFILDGADQRYFNPLIGVPAIQYGYDEFDDSFGQNVLDSSSPTIDPYATENIDFINIPFHDESITVRGTVTEADDDTAYVHLRARKISSGRADQENVHPDGRYYETLADLVMPRLRDIGSEFREEYPTYLSELWGSTDQAVDPNEELPRLRETKERFSRIANMVTTKSDTFKIYVTVQTGYVTDVNGDGILNYRDDAEFTTTSEKEATTIYQR